MNHAAEKISKNGPILFEKDLPVTSSPIEGKLIDDHSLIHVHDLPTWAALLGDYQSQNNFNQKIESSGGSSVSEDVLSSNFSHDEKTEDTTFLPPTSPHRTHRSISSSSSLQPIAEHVVRVLVTPNRKIRVVSNIDHKTSNRSTPMKSYTKLSRACRMRCEAEESEIDMKKIKDDLSSKNVLTLKDIELAENQVRKYLSQHQHLQQKKETEAFMSSDVMTYVKKNIGELNLTPRTVRVLKLKQQQQEKRLISLAVAKRKSSADIRKRIHQQQSHLHQEVSERERQEMKQIKASQLRNEAIALSHMFNKFHLARHKEATIKTRQKDFVNRLDRKMLQENKQNKSEANKLVEGIWKTLMEQQFNELRQELCKQRQTQKQLVAESANKLKQSKYNYEEKLKELKEAVQIKAVESGLRKKEIEAELDRIERAMRSQFESEFQNLLQKIQHTGEHRRFIKGEKAERIRQLIQKGDFIFDFRVIPCKFPALADPSAFNIWM